MGLNSEDIDDFVDMTLGGSRVDGTVFNAFFTEWEPPERWRRTRKPWRCAMKRLAKMILWLVMWPFSIIAWPLSAAYRAAEFTWGLVRFYRVNGLVSYIGNLNRLMFATQVLMSRIDMREMVAANQTERIVGAIEGLRQEWIHLKGTEITAEALDELTKRSREIVLSFYLDHFDDLKPCMLVRAKGCGIVTANAIIAWRDRHLEEANEQRKTQGREVRRMVAPTER